MNTLEIIKKHGLSLRRIPLIKVENWLLSGTGEAREGYEVRTNLKTGRRSEYREYAPKNAGYWMCQMTPHTSTQVVWDTDTHTLAPTLEESVELFEERYNASTNRQI